MSAAVLAKREKVVKIIMDIDDELKLDVIEEYLQDFTQRDSEDDWDNLTLEQQTELEEAVKECDEHPENLIPHEVVMQNMSKWLKR